MHILSVTPCHNARTMDRKELVNSFTVTDCKTGREVVKARFYMSRSRTASVVYCVVWVHPLNASGLGSAGGGGYHKESAALAEALESAGIKLSQDISGIGEEAMKDALKAIAEHCGIDNFVLSGI